MVKPKWQYILVGMLLILVAYIGFLVKFIVDSSAERTHLGWGLPVISITLNDVDLDTIHENSKTEVYPGNKLSLTNNSVTLKYDDVELTGRGNTTLLLDKRPYQITFKHKTNLLGLGEAKKWILLADAFDSTHLRNDVAFYLEDMLDEEYAIDGRHVMLYVDGKLRGLYYLTEKVEIAKSRVDLKDPLGVLVEIDNIHNALDTLYRSKWGECLIVKDLVSKDNEVEAMGDFLSSFNELEVALEANDYATAQQLIDVDSFAKYYLLSEFTMNPDAYSTSWYFYKDGPNDKIHVGPGWDFDLALANEKWIWHIDQDFFSPYQTRAREIEAFGGGYYNSQNEYKYLEENSTVSKLFYRLLKIPDFYDLVLRTYEEKMAGRWPELKNFVVNQATKIYIPAKKDELLWEQKDYARSVAELLSWLEKRYEYFERTYR